MAAATQQMSSLPSGLKICTTAPDILYLPELVFGGLVWILVASTHVSIYGADINVNSNPQGLANVVSNALGLVNINSNPLGWLNDSNPLGWVMFVSVFCFVMTFLWLILFACGAHKNSSRWATADFIYHLIAVIFYLSASVVLANVTITMKTLASLSTNSFKYYQIDIAAVVFSFLATLLYFIHSILSALRWKSF